MSTKPNKKWIMGRLAMSGSLLVAHFWGTLLIVAVLRGNQAAVLGDMFASVLFLIFSTLAVMVGGKGWKSFAAMKWAGEK